MHFKILFKFFIIRTRQIIYQKNMYFFRYIFFSIKFKLINKKKIFQLIFQFFTFNFCNFKDFLTFKLYNPEKLAIICLKIKWKNLTDF